MPSVFHITISFNPPENVFMRSSHLQWFIMYLPDRGHVGLFVEPLQWARQKEVAGEKEEPSKNPLEQGEGCAFKCSGHFSLRVKAWLPSLPKILKKWLRSSFLFGGFFHFYCNWKTLLVRKGKSRAEHSLLFLLVDQVLMGTLLYNSPTGLKEFKKKKSCALRMQQIFHLHD